MWIQHRSSTLVLAGVCAGFMVTACGSESTPIAALDPGQTTNTSLQVTTRPVIYSPRRVNGNLRRSQPGETVTFEGTGFANVTTVTFQGGLGGNDDVEAEFSIASDNQLLVTIPEDAASGLIQISTGFNAAYRRYIAPIEIEPLPSPTPTPTPADIQVNPVDLDFGSVTVGFFSSESVRVSNFGGTILGVEGVGFDLDNDNDPDSLNLDASGDGITDFSVTSQAIFQVDPDTVEGITVICIPSEAELLEAELVIQSNDPSDQFTVVNLTCQGVNPQD